MSKDFKFLIEEIFLFFIIIMGKYWIEGTRGGVKVITFIVIELTVMRLIYVMKKSLDYTLEKKS